jgi:hypothetical protein
MGVGCRGIIAFSPDASSLLCRVSGSAIDVVDLASGRHEELRVGVPSSNLRLAHWDRDGLRFISLDNETPKLVNATTGAVTLLRETSLGADESHMTDTFAWSRDGRFVAMWTRYCRPVGFGGECDKGEMRLHVVDLTTRGSRQVAAIRGLGGTVAFSPDGRRLVYAGGPQFSAGIYVVRLD